MNRVRVSKMTSLFVCSFFVVQAAAQTVDDQTEQQRILQRAIATSPECQGLPIDVPNSIIIHDGVVTTQDPMMFTQFWHDVRLQNQFNNCISRVGNAIQAQTTQDNANPNLVKKLQNAAMKFVSTIAALTAKSGPDLRIDKTAELGSRG